MMLCIINDCNSCGIKLAVRNRQPSEQLQYEIDVIRNLQSTIAIGRKGIGMEHLHESDLPRYGLYIDGHWIGAASGEVMAVNEPALGAPMAYIARGNAEDVDRAVRAARQAFDRGPWPHTPPHERARILHAIADAFEARSAEFAEIEARNLGASLRKTTFVDVPMAVEHFRAFAELARRPAYEPLPWIDMPSVSWNFVWREPIGVCGQIIPWNYPLLMAAWKLAPALATGNTVVLKPASYTPLTALM